MRGTTEANRDIWDSFVPDFIDDRVRKAATLLPSLGGSGRYLDIGCSNGVITRLFADRLEAGEVYGVDIVHVEEARKRGVRAMAFDLNNGGRLPFEDNHFHAVTCLETLEHVQDTDFLLSEMRRVMREDGIAVIDVPRLDSLMNAALLALGFQPPGVECSTRRRYGAINEGSFLTGHVSYFTKKALLEMLRAHNFRVLGFRQVSQKSSWKLSREKLGHKTGFLPGLLWSLYGLIPFKKDYMILSVAKK